MLRLMPGIPEVWWYKFNDFMISESLEGAMVCSNLKFVTGHPVAAWFHMWHERVRVREGERVLLTRVRSVLEQRLCGRSLCGWARATRLSRWTKVRPTPSIITD